MITIHVEAVDDPRPVLEQIRQMGAGAGLALNPATPLERISSSLDLCDLVLVMSVPAGFGGQPFDPIAIDKLQQVRGMGGSDVLLEVDGGINKATIRGAAEAGAQLFVVGSAIFRSSDYGQTVQELRDLATIAL
jgi:ribulose-phosphate 3-epimerase